MLYKTIILELIRSRPILHRRLKASTILLPTVDLLAAELKARHEAWKESIRRERPISDPAQVGSEAMELALEGLKANLPAEDTAPVDQIGPLTLDAAMAFIRRDTPPA